MSISEESGGAAAARLTAGQRLRGLLALTKPRIMSLLLFTAAVGAVMGGVQSGQGVNWLAIVATLIGGALTSGGASALNIALETDLDGSMRRTSRRPVTAGVVGQREAIAFGLALNFIGFAALALMANLLAASLAIAGSLLYVGLYTLVLKRSTIHNIVVGGAAGAMPPLVGYAAASGGLDIAALYLFAIIFFWTPPHFWALSLLIRDDYAEAGVPMLPVVHGGGATRLQILLYSVLLTGLTLSFAAVTSMLGLIYLGGALILNWWLLWLAWRLRRHATRGAALRLYLYSLAYLFLLFGLAAGSALLSLTGLPI